MASRFLVADLRIAAAGDMTEVSARIDASAIGWRGKRVWFRMPAAVAPTTPHGDAFVVALLLPAMASGATLTIDAPVSSTLLRNLEEAQHLLLAWNARNPWTRLHRVAIAPSRLEEAATGPDTTGLFFSGGVDSLYSLLHAQHDTGGHVDTLLFVRGFDVPLSAKSLAGSVEGEIHAIASAAGRPLITVGTNLRDVTDRAITWEMEHGAALAAVGHLFGHIAQRWVLSSADAYLTNAPYGTNHALDPLWSRHGLAVITAGLGVDRAAKLAALAREPLAHQHLLVCWQDRPTAANCGRCAKCVRTSLQLLVIDALSRFRTLPSTVEPALVAAILAEPAHRQFLWEDILERLRTRPEWNPLAEQVDRLIDRTRRADRRPQLTDFGTREGRRIAAEWLRRRVQPRVPVPIRRQLVARRRPLP
jgi:hypothetical protein